MTYDVKNRIRENAGSVNISFIEIDVTGYNGTGTTGEDVSASALDLAQDPIHVTPTPDGKNINARYDRSADRVRLFYPTASHSHTALQSSGSDTTLGAHQGMQDGAGNGTTLQVGVDTSGQSSVSVSTSSDGGDSNDGPGDELADGDTGGLVQLVVWHHGS